MIEALVKKNEREEKQLAYMGGISTVPGSYEPENLRAAMDLAQVLCEGGLVPRDLQHRSGDVLTLIATGREYGLAWPAALQNLYVVHGRIGSYAEFQRARIMQHPDCEIFELVEATKERAAFKVKKTTMDEPAIVEFTVEDAIDAQLMKRLDNGNVVGFKGPDSNWSKYTSDMLVARATTRAKRRYFPYVLTDLAAVEELRDLPEEKNITPKADLAAERAQTIAEAAGRKVPTETEVREAEQEEELAKAIEQQAKTDPENQPHQWSDEGDEPEDAPKPERKPLEPEEPVQRIPATLRRKMVAEVEGIGAKSLTTLEEAGLVTARHIWQKGVPGLADLPGFGKAKAAALHAWANALVDESLREQAKAKAAEDEGEEGGVTTEQRFRDQEYVKALMASAEEHGVTKEQLRKKLDELAASVDLPAGLGPRALPDPQWKTLSEWVASATQGSLPIGEDAEGEGEEEEAEPAGPAVISEKRAAIVYGVVQKIAQHYGDENAEAAEQWEADFYAFLKERWGASKAEEIPEAAYQEVLAYMTEHDPR